MDTRVADILRYKTESEVVSIVTRLGEAPMTETAHGFEKYAGMTIRDAAIRQAAENLSPAAGATPAIRLMDVVLAANRNYKNHVLKNIERIKNERPTLDFRTLRELISRHDFRSFKSVWGHANQRKFTLLSELLDSLECLRIEGEADLDLMIRWAKQAELSNPGALTLPRLKNFGVATHQHLRMAFGVDTVKPDLRVKQVLIAEFDVVRPTDLQAIHLATEIAKIVQLRVIEIDQIFVKYGSGYYYKKARRMLEMGCR